MRITEVWYQVTQWQEAVAFYRDLIGLKCVHEDAGSGIAGFDTEGGPTLVLARGDACPAVIGLTVADLEALRIRLQQSGVAFEAKPRGRGSLQLLAFQDPAGNRIEAWPWEGRTRVKPTVVSAVVTNKAGAVLLVRPSYRDRWDLPGGEIEDFEGPLEGLSREVQEEAGTLPVDPVLTGIDHNKLRDAVIFVFRCGLAGLPKVDGREIVDHCFVPPRDVERLTTPWVADRMLDALEFAGRVAVRTQVREGDRLIASRARPW